VTLTAPDPHATSSFLNVRVANIQEIYENWSSKGAQFLTPPIDRGPELPCYLRDPDGHLIEVGQANHDFLKEHLSSDPTKASVKRATHEATP
jgi:predicted lactoylglutathione lyase